MEWNIRYTEVQSQHFTGSPSLSDNPQINSQQVFDFYSNRYEQGALKASSYWLLVSEYRLLGWRVGVVAWCEYKLWQVTKTFSRELFTFSVFFSVYQLNLFSFASHPVYR